MQEGIRADIAPVEALLRSVEEDAKPREPPKATVARRAKSYSDFYDVVRAHVEKENRLEREKQRKRHNQKQIKNELEFGAWYHGLQNELLDASHEEYQYVYTATVIMRYIANLRTDYTATSCILPNNT
jgi:hypothetical protein